MATPLAAFLRVPLDWYHSRLFPRHADETEHMIRRRYLHGADAQRIFCGFCGTPVTYWDPKGQRDSDYINVTLGSLDGEDIHDLESMGLVPTLESDESDKGRDTADEGESKSTIKDAPPTLDSAMEVFIREFSEVPWFDALVEGSLLGKLTQKNKRKPGKIAVQVIEWPDSEGPGAGDAERGGVSGKRKFGEVEGA